jgi:Family of unknown function (DUF5678)
MARAALVAHNHAADLYVPRIRALLEVARLKAARELLAEALRTGSPEPELDQLAKLLAPPKPRPSPARDFDRTAEFLWLSENGEKYMGQWVAVLGDRLLAHASTFQELQSKLDTVARDQPVLLHHLS